MKLRDGDLKEAAFYIGFSIVLAYMSSTIPQGVVGFQPIPLPHHEWMPSSHSRPPYPGEYGKVGERINIRLQDSKHVAVSQNPTSTQMSTFVKQGKVDPEICLSRSSSKNKSM